MTAKTSMIEVMKNIYTYANILSAANTKLVKCWDLSSVTNALKWANYCMKIEKEMRKCIFRGDLDRQLQSMTVFLNPVSLLLLSVDTLSDAPYLLYKSLVQNPYTPADVLSILEDTFGCFAKQRVSHCQRRKMQLGDKIYQLLCEDVSFAEQSDKSQAFHIMTRLVKLQKICHPSQQRYDRFLEKVIMELKHRNGWNVIVYMFLVDVVCEADHDVVTDVKKKMLDAVTLMATDFNCGLWKCTWSLLSEVSAFDSSFADIYADHLMLWAQDMVPEYALQDNGDVYYWRHKDIYMSMNGYSFTELKKHMHGILTSSSTLKRKMEKMLKEKSELSHFNIHKDLLRYCNDIKNRIHSAGAL